MMRYLFACLILSVLPISAAAAKEYRFVKTIDPAALQTELVAAGFKVRHITCVAESCAISLEDSEAKSPKKIVDSYVFINSSLRRRQDLAELRALAEKWKAGTITPSEKDQLILRFILRGLPED